MAKKKKLKNKLALARELTATRTRERNKLLDDLKAIYNCNGCNHCKQIAYQNIKWYQMMDRANEAMKRVYTDVLNDQKRATFGLSYLLQEAHNERTGDK